MNAADLLAAAAGDVLEPGELWGDEDDLPAQELSLSVEAGGERLDRYLTARLPALSRSAIQRLIEGGEVLVNGAPSRPAYKVRAGDALLVRIPPPEPTELLPEPIPLDIVYEDEALIVINKPAGLVVHPGAGNPRGTLVNALLYHCPTLEVGGAVRPGIVHRLDKDTSGLLVVAKNDAAHQGLQQQFKRREVRKRYVALVSGAVSAVSGSINAPIGRHPVQRIKMAVVEGGREARTRWTVRTRYVDAAGRPYTLLDVDLETGRTHQIRVHLAWLGYPLVGDALYGPARAPLAAPRQCLHAAALSFTHPLSGAALSFTAPLPADFAAVLAQLTPLPGPAERT